MATPALQAPPGKSTDFRNPNRQMYVICIVSNVIAIPVCTLFILLRLWARYRLSKRLQVDDVLCVLGYIGFMGYCGICLLMLRYGGGLHEWDVPESEIGDYYKTVYATMVNYGPTVFAIKASILLFLTRVFSPYKTYVRWIYGFLVCISIYYAVMMLCKILICRPISMFWGATTNGTCFDERSLILTDSVISVVSDAVVLLLPLPLTKDLQVGIKAKLKIGLVFGVGGIAVVFSLIRLVFIIQEGQSADQTYAFLQINLFGIAECGIGVVCACFPLLPALWKSILHKTKSGYSSNSKSQFEMMPSSQKPSRTAAHHHGTIIYKNETDSDENDLISRAKPNVMTDIRAANDDLHGSGVGSKCHHNDRWDDSQIVRTVEVFQYVEE